jgi:hypothetical protein
MAAMWSSHTPLTARRKRSPSTAASIASALLPSVPDTVPPDRGNAGTIRSSASRSRYSATRSLKPLYRCSPSALCVSAALSPGYPSDPNSLRCSTMVYAWRKFSSKDILDAFLFWISRIACESLAQLSLYDVLGPSCGGVSKCCLSEAGNFDRLRHSYSRHSRSRCRAIS